MIGSRKILVPLALCAVLSGCGPKTYTLALNAKQGQTYTYDIAATGGFSMDTKMSMTVDKVEGGNTTFREKIDSVTTNGNPAPPSAADAIRKMTIIEVKDKRGNVVSTKTENAPAGAPSQMSVRTAVFPDHPVKVGDTWTSTMNGVEATYKFASVGTENGKTVANLEVTVANNPNFKPDGPGKLSIDLDSGMPVTMTISETVTPIGKVTMTMKQIS